MMDCNGRNRAVGQCKGDAFAREITLKKAGLSGDLPIYLEEFQAFQKGPRTILFLRAQAGVYLRDIDRAAGQEIPAVEQSFQEPLPLIATVQDVNNDAGIQKVIGHLSDSSFY